MSSTTTTWSTDTNTKSGSATTFTDTVSSLQLIAGEGEDAILKLFADEGDDNADQWRIVSKASNNKLNFMSYAGGSWSNVLSLFGSGTASSVYLALPATSKLYLDGGGTTYIQESSDGYLKINSGATLDLTAPTVDLNSSTEFNIDTVLYDLNASGAVTLNGTTFALVGTTIDIDGSGAMQINSSGGTISIGNDDVDQDINIGTQGERTINIGAGTFLTEVVVGNTAGGSGVHLKAGTGDVQITGNLGIGIAGPERALHILSTDASIASFDGHQNEGFVISSATSGRIDLIGYSDDNDDYNDIVIRADNSAQLYLKSSGGVGVGTNSPANTLHIAHGATDANNGIMIVNVATTIADGALLGSIGFDGADGNIPSSTLESSCFIAAYAAEDHSASAKGGDLVFGCTANGTADDQTSTEYMRILDSGNIGIGVNDPDAVLEIFSTSTQLKLSFDATDFCTFTVDTNHDITIKPSSTGQIILQPTTDSSDFFQVLDADGGFPVLNVDSSNERVGIGTSAPARSLHVRGADANIASFEGHQGEGLVISSAVNGRIDIIGYDDGATDYNDIMIRAGGTNSSGIYISKTVGDIGVGTDAPEGRLSLVSGMHIIAIDQTIRFADSGDNTVIVQIDGYKIPAKAIITRVAAVVVTDSDLGTHLVNIQMSATASTAADSTISSGTELLGAGCPADATFASTDTAYGGTREDIDMGDGNDEKDVWFSNAIVRNGTSDQYIYVCNAGTGNGTTNSTAGTLSIIIEYYGVD